jgi:hypothetical protein
MLDIGFAVFSNDIFKRIPYGQDYGKPSFELNWANKQFTTLFETSSVPLTDALNIILFSEIDNGPQPLSFPKTYSIMQLLKDYKD